MLLLLLLVVGCCCSLVVVVVLLLLVPAAGGTSGWLAALLGQQEARAKEEPACCVGCCLAQATPSLQLAQHLFPPFWAFSFCLQQFANHLLSGVNLAAQSVKVKDTNGRLYALSTMELVSYNCLSNLQSILFPFDNSEDYLSACEAAILQ